jgi:hypothetical protein
LLVPSLHHSPIHLAERQSLVVVVARLLVRSPATTTTRDCRYARASDFKMQQKPDANALTLTLEDTSY